MKERANFGSKLGVIMASAGSAVGLGNIWRFPSETGNNGGSAFILVYIVCVLLLGMPIMISEFIIGRHSHANTATAYKKLSPNTHWHLVGKLGVLAGFLILSYYSVVAGWTLDYMAASAMNKFSFMYNEGGSGAFKTYFDGFISNPFRPTLYLVLFLFITHFVIVRGVEKGIEKFSNIFMPILFILLFVLMICSLMMPGASEGLHFLFNPDFSKITSDVVLAAMGQAFFSLSLGMGCLCTYASYFGKEIKLGKTALNVSIIDSCVAIMAGVVIFPAVFSVGGSVTEGPALLFVTLPNIFQSIFGSVPALAYGFSLMFYSLLVLATLTSTISMHEVVTAYLSEAYKMSRTKAARMVTAGCIFLGLFCSLSMGVLKGHTLFDMNLFSLLDFVTAKLMLPIGGFFIAIYTGWFLSRQIIRSEMTNGGIEKFPLFPVFFFMLRFLVPAGILLVFLNELGLIAFL